MQENMIKENKLNLFKLDNYWRNIDKQILASFFLLFTLGAFFSFSSTSFLADERLDKNYYFFFQKHLFYAFVSFLVMIFISVLNTEIINKFLLPIFLIFLITLILVPFTGIEVKGAQRWLSFLGFRFQPVEFIKPFFILISAQILCVSWIKNINLSYIISFILLSTVVFLLIIQPDLGQSVLLVGAWGSLIFVSGVNIYFLALLFIFIIFIFFSLLYFSPDKFNYIINRL